MIRSPASTRHRALFISDVHLGTRGCQAEALLAFLRRNEADVIYLVGDFIDLVRVGRRAYWPECHSDVLLEILRQGAAGTRLVLTTGNHDASLGAILGAGNLGTPTPSATGVAAVEVVREAIHITADGRRLLIVHGDQFDPFVARAGWLAATGERSNAIIHACSARLRSAGESLRSAGQRLGLAGGIHRTSGAWRLRRRFKAAFSLIEAYEAAAAAYARQTGVDGIICGHAHHAADRTIDNIRYINCGDWISSLTAVVEGRDGRVGIVDASAWKREDSTRHWSRIGDQPSELHTQRPSGDAHEWR